jgi:hypothetical protein
MQRCLTLAGALVVASLLLTPAFATCPAGVTDPLTVALGAWAYQTTGENAALDRPMGAIGTFIVTIRPATPTIPEQGLVSVNEANAGPGNGNGTVGTNQGLATIFAPTSPRQGLITVNADCTGGTIMLGPSGGQNSFRTFAFVFAQGFNQMYLLSVDDSNAVITGVAKRQ